MSVVRNAHFFRKLPAELTDATNVGGALSIFAIVAMGSLLVSNTQAYLSSTTTKTRLELDIETSEFVELRFNITMERLPCRFTVVDVFDESGTKRLNISQDIVKRRVDAADGHFLDIADPEMWVDETSEGVFTEPHILADDDSESQVPTLVTEAEFETFVQNKDLVMVAFGAPWCPFSRRLDPIWTAVHERVQTDGLLVNADLARVDCTQSKALCGEQQVHAFPTMRVYRSHNFHSHEEYHGERTADDIHSFLLETVDALEDHLGWHPHTRLSHLSGEGCQVQGNLVISRVPGTLRIAARSPSASHSFDPLNLNVTHHVDSLTFAALSDAGRRYAKSRYAASRTGRGASARGGRREGALGEAGLSSETFVMHEQATTLKHYLKVVPTRRLGLSGEEPLDSYEYSNFYNEFHGKREAETHRLVPNTVFSFDISPFRVVHRESAESFGSFVTQLCAVVGGVFTVFGILDSMLHGVVKVIKQD